jgi:hypothetical protein
MCHFMLHITVLHALLIIPVRATCHTYYTLIIFYPVNYIFTATSLAASR